MKAIITALVIIFGLTGCNPHKLVYTKSGFTISKSQRKIQRNMHNHAKIVIRHRPFKRTDRTDKAPTIRMEGAAAYNERKAGLR